MAFGPNPRERYSYGSVTSKNHRQFQQALGLSVERPVEPSLRSLGRELPDASSDHLADLGKSVREGLSGPLNEELLEREVAEVATRFERFAELREVGTPEYEQTLYGELTDAAWRLYEHLEAVGFFASAEDSLPPFTAEFIETTTRQLLVMPDLTETMTRIGLPDQEQLALVTNIVTSSEQLSWWELTRHYPSADDVGRDDGVEHDYVPPLHQRAMGGVLIWIDGLDWHLWQNRILITDEMIERAVWDVKSMLAGVYLLGEAALRIARGTISDEDLTTMVTSSTAIMVIGQEFLVDDVAWITDEDRRPIGAAHGDAYGGGDS